MLSGASGTIWTEEWMRIEKKSQDRTFVCKGCGSRYFFNPTTGESLIKLMCSSCGSILVAEE